MEKPAKSGAATHRVLYFDVMNVLACMAVVAAHHNNQLHSFSNSFGWVFSLGMECLLYWAVPIFMMVSGATLMGFHKRCSLREYFQRRILRTVVPWLIWSTVLLLWNLKIGQIPGGEGPVYYLRLILTNQVESIYWFFSTLFGCYLMIPFLTRLIHHRTALWYGAAVIFLLSLFQPLLASYAPISNDSITTLRNSLIIYVLLGYLLNTAQLSKKQRIWLYIAGALSVMMRFGVTWVLSVENQATSLAVRGAKMCNTIACASAVFVFLKHTDWEKLLPAWLKKALPTLAGCSFGVYLLHRVVMHYEQQWFGLRLSDMVYKTLWIPVTYFVCIAIIWLLKKIPVLGKYIC